MRGYKAIYGIRCPICKKIGKVCKSRICNRSFICMACGQRINKSLIEQQKIETFK